jgi:hypothetical protein
MLRAPKYWQSVTPSDTATLGPCIGLFVTAAGNVAFLGEGGAAVIVTVPNNFYLWSEVRQVLATGTTATGIFLLR